MSELNAYVMRNYNVSLELRDEQLNIKATLFSRNALDADQLINVATSFGIEYSLESDMLLLSSPMSLKKKVFSIKIHKVGYRKQATLTEFRRVARFIGATNI